jgi:hypothetical protein
LRAGFAGAYALDWNIVFEIVRLRGMDIDERLIEYLKIYEDKYIAYLNRKNK